MLSRCSCVPPFVTLWIIAHQASLSVGFSRQQCWSGLPCPPPGDLPNSRIKPMPLRFPAFAGQVFTTSATWEAWCIYVTPNLPARLILPFAPMSTYPFSTSLFLFLPWKQVCLYHFSRSCACVLICNIWLWMGPLPSLNLTFLLLLVYPLSILLFCEGMKKRRRAAHISTVYFARLGGASDFSSESIIKDSKR